MWIWRRKKCKKVVSDEMIIGGKDDKSQYLEDEDVEIIIV
jgi:hypothetical protein